MPEEFITDPSVPPRWRILAYMNGFFINGLTFYASNEAITKKLGIKQWAISKAISELEEMGKIRCERTRRGRVCYPAGKVVVGSAETLPPQCVDTISDSAETLPNAVSNAVNKNSELINSQFVVVNDTDDLPKKAKSTCYQVFEVFQEVLGIYPLNWRTNRTQRTAGENLFKERGLDQVRKALEFYRETKDEPFCPQVLSPWELDTKWKKLITFKNKYGN